MKNIFQGFLIILISIFGLSVEFSCNDCDLSAEFLLTDQQKKQNPLNGYEIMIYKKLNTDFQLNGIGRTELKQEVLVSKNECDYSIYETDITQFENDYYLVTYYMAGRTTYGFYILDKASIFNMYSGFEIDQETGELSDYTENIDSLVLNGVHYSDIYKDTLKYSQNDSISIDTLNHATYLYYSTDYGIIKIDFSDGSSWELEEIIWK